MPTSGLFLQQDRLAGELEKPNKPGGCELEGSRASLKAEWQGTLGERREPAGTSFVRNSVGSLFEE